MLCFTSHILGQHQIVNSWLTLKTSHVEENGRTASPTRRSATARFTMKKFVTLLSLWEQKTAAITRQLPTITSTLMTASTANDTKFPGSVHSTASINFAHSVWFMVTPTLNTFPPVDHPYHPLRHLSRGSLQK